MTYHQLWLKYQRISNINTLRARKKDTPEAYERAQNREKLIMKAFFNDVKRYLKSEDL